MPLLLVLSNVSDSLVTVYGAMSAFLYGEPVYFSYCSWVYRLFCYIRLEIGTMGLRRVYRRSWQGPGWESAIVVHAMITHLLVTCVTSFW